MASFDFGNCYSVFISRVFCPLLSFFFTQAERDNAKVFRKIWWVGITHKYPSFLVASRLRLGFLFIFRKIQRKKIFWKIVCSLSLSLMTMRPRSTALTGLTLLCLQNYDERRTLYNKWPGTDKPSMLCSFIHLIDRFFIQSIRTIPHVSICSRIFANFSISQFPMHRDLTWPTFADNGHSFFRCFAMWLWIFLLHIYFFYNHFSVFFIYIFCFFPHFWICISFWLHIFDGSWFELFVIFKR